MCVCLLQSFQGVVGKDEAFPDSVKNLISTNYDPLYKFHLGFLKEVEQRLAQWSVSVCPLQHIRSSLKKQQHRTTAYLYSELRIEKRGNANNFLKKQSDHIQKKLMSPFIGIQDT